MRIQTEARVVVRGKADVARKRVIAVGKRQNGRWKVRTSLWRYLAETTISQ